MADKFSFTDSDDERAVEDVLSQALDHSVLEQIAAINCSSFSTSDSLPSDLENRFRKLKSLPTATAGSLRPPSKSKSFTPRSAADSNPNEASTNSVDFQRSPDLKNCSEKPSPVTDESSQHSDGNRDENKGTDSKSKSKNSKSLSNSKDLKSRSRNSSESRSDSWSVSSPESESRSVSPVRRRGIGCLWCSPKKEKRKQGKENGMTSLGDDYDVEFLKTFSTKEQEKIMRKAMKEEEKINREAEKIVKWAKQASARMMDVDVCGVDDELSDLEK